MSDDVVTLAKLAVRHANLINLISAQLADHACFVKPMLPRCQKCSIEPITVEHALLNIKACDRCAAEMMVRSSRAYVDGYIVDPSDPFNDVRLSLLNENDWVDVDNADKIRRLIDYVEIIEGLDVQQSVGQVH